MLVLINLEGAVERRQRMLQQLDGMGLSCERIGFDGRHLDPAAIARWAGERFPNLSFARHALSGAEVGCWLSHLGAWQRLLARPDQPACAVIEDDLVLRPSFDAAIAILTARSPYDVVYLGTSSRNLSTRRRSLIDGLCLHEPIGPVFNTWGYVIRRDWVERFFGQRDIRIRAPIDHLLGGKVRGPKPRIAVLQPPVVEEDPILGTASQIEPYTWRIDRARIVATTRRRLLASKVGDFYYALYRFL